MKKINNFLNTLMGVSMGVFLGHGIYLFWDCKTHPALYAMQSAPWYTRLFVDGITLIIVLLTAGIIKYIIHRKSARAPAEDDPAQQPRPRA